MKSCTEPLAYGVDRLEPKCAFEITVWKAPIFHDAVAWPAHWRCTSSIWVASYTPERSTVPFWQTSARLPRIGPDVITGEQTRVRFSAARIERGIACSRLSG